MDAAEVTLRSDLSKPTRYGKSRRQQESIIEVTLVADGTELNYEMEGMNNAWGSDHFQIVIEVARRRKASKTKKQSHTIISDKFRRLLKDENGNLGPNNLAADLEATMKAVADEEGHDRSTYPVMQIDEEDSSAITVVLEDHSFEKRQTKYSVFGRGYKGKQLELRFAGVPLPAKAKIKTLGVNFGYDANLVDTWLKEFLVKWKKELSLDFLGSVSRKKSLSLCRGVHGTSSTLPMPIGYKPVPKNHNAQRHQNGREHFSLQHIKQVGELLSHEKTTVAYADAAVTRRDWAVYGVFRRQEHQEWRKGASCSGSKEITSDMAEFRESLAALKTYDKAERKTRNLVICTDAQVVLGDLKRLKPTAGPTVAYIFDKALALYRAYGTRVSIKWAPRHEDIPGNSMAHAAAQRDMRILASPFTSSDSVVSDE
ncbi:hypothetical protein HPB47_023007 [Ixodes persulcatus]|uniref:Uncharacterized protein n=1 Tax=Ixodes persulcatus TaxID=34615 RepID=A0AC60QBH8_IXOPE|nr:hypothetical protein HPB47_023007 [Ixodes persulcatus]